LECGADRNPDGYPISVVVDGEVLFSGPLSPGITAGIKKEPVYNLAIPLDSLEKGIKIWMRLSKGPLPVDLVIRNTSNQT